ncbi:hypothetical protein KGQ20_02205 [Catenulispora sp. NF23]|uniref:Uncharacterized protein n=1 Tax=Catenulispora pinistramenti TaxID=2705254 RepID=A0ABS5KJ95_9ACTN|nr:hypothetical protein [Catenulispora pinistramenti]MBS2531578.1 hypothetical protein [Catenulispora pinistramenti]MBS2546172.1 hypothetical protein [Catenulispora pinistramenti]
MSPAADAPDDEGLELELERRLAGKADWHYAGELADRVAELERWRAAVEAVAASRRWALPVSVSIVGLVLTVANLANLLIHHK